jgi:hypothetical protein
MDLDPLTMINFHSATCCKSAVHSVLIVQRHSVNGLYILHGFKLWCRDNLEVNNSVI